MFVLVVLNLFCIVWVSFLFFKVYWSISSYLHRVLSVMTKISGTALSGRKNYLKVELVHILYLITLSFVYFVLHFFVISSPGFLIVKSDNIFCYLYHTLKLYTLVTMSQMLWKSSWTFDRVICFLLLNYKVQYTYLCGYNINRYCKYSIWATTVEQSDSLMNAFFSHIFIF